MFHDSYEWYHLKLNFHDLNKWCVLDMDAFPMGKASDRLALDSIHQNYLRHLIKTYRTTLLVSFQLRLGLAVHIVKFRPKQPEKLQ